MIDRAKLSALAADPGSALEIGKAAEHLVVADLILSGYRAYLSDQGLPYDVLIDIAGKIIRVQVKASCFVRNVNSQGKRESLCYSFHVRLHGKLNRKRLSDEECDLAALVAIDIGAIAYLPIFEVGTTCQLPPPGASFKGRYKRSWLRGIDKYPIGEAVDRLMKGASQASLLTDVSR